MCANAGSSAWPQPPSGSPTSWSPANGRVTFPPGPNAIAGARSPVKDRVLSNSVSRRPRETPCAGATPVAPLEVLSAGTEGTLPRPVPRQRPGPAYGLVLLGDPPSFDEDDSDPHVCVMPCDAVAVPSLAATPACLATWAGGLLFGVDGVAGHRFRHARGCLPRPRDRLGRHDSSGFDQGLLWSRRAPRVVRRSREAAALPCSMPVPPVLTCRPMAHPVDPPPPPFSRVAHPCPMPVHLPGDSRMP